MTITPITSNTVSILPKLSEADQKKFDQVKQNLQSALDTIKQTAKGSGKSQANAQKKAMAQQRVAQIKQAIKALRQFNGLDPKATARMVAQLAKQLEQAVKDYVSAGGDDVSVTSTADSNATASGQASGSNSSDTASTAGSATTTTGTPAGNAANAYAQAQGLSSVQGADDAADKQFLKDVNEIRDDLRSFSKQLRNNLKHKGMVGNIDPDLKEVNEADKALDEVDKALAKLQN